MPKFAYMTIFEIIISALAFVLVWRLLLEYFRKHPSDKYHNDSWKNRNK